VFRKVNVERTSGSRQPSGRLERPFDLGWKRYERFHQHDVRLFGRIGIVRLASFKAGLLARTCLPALAARIDHSAWAYWPGDIDGVDQRPG
jgi:hypothetical protein